MRCVARNLIYISDTSAFDRGKYFEDPATGKRLFQSRGHVVNRERINLIGMAKWIPRCRSEYTG